MDATPRIASCLGARRESLRSRRGRSSDARGGYSSVPARCGRLASTEAIDGGPISSSMAASHRCYAERGRMFARWNLEFSSDAVQTATGHSASRRTVPQPPLWRPRSTHREAPTSIAFSSATTPPRARRSRLADEHHARPEHQGLGGLNLAADALTRRYTSGGRCWLRRVIATT